VSPDQVLIIIAIVTAAWTANRILRPLGEALARRIGGTGRLTAAQEGEVADLRARLAELEERVDFAERLLARWPAAQAALPRGVP